MRPPDARLKDFTVTCSCGAEALIIFSPSLDDWTPAKVFREQGWTFSDDMVPGKTGRLRFAGWNCGQAGHYRRPRHSMTKAEYLLFMLEYRKAARERAEELFG